MKEQWMPYLRQIASPRGWAYGLFWSWNAIFLAFMGLGFAPLILPEMIDAVPPTRSRRHSWPMP